jgi:hypothetical protein
MGKKDTDVSKEEQIKKLQADLESLKKQLPAPAKTEEAEETMTEETATPIMAEDNFAMFTMDHKLNTLYLGYLSVAAKLENIAERITAIEQGIGPTSSG